MGRRNFLAVLFILILIFTTAGCLPFDAELGSDPRPGGMQAHFLDVGQGDATLLMGPDFTVLIDAGRHDREDVVPYLTRAGVEKLDLLVATHPHSDHIGQMDEVLKQFPVDEVWMNGAEHTSRTFERTVEAIADSEASYYEPRAGEQFQIGSLEVEVLHPQTLPQDLNNGSIVIRVIYGDVSFLFTGDIEKPAEEEILSQGHDVEADIYHMGHHGSSTSNHKAFVEAVNPEVAIYSAGQGNEYGHPHKEVLALFEALGIPVYGTDRYGTIIVRTDGKTFKVETEKE